MFIVLLEFSFNGWLCALFCFFCFRRYKTVY